jgi:hypothetical protein
MDYEKAIARVRAALELAPVESFTRAEPVATTRRDYYEIFRRPARRRRARDQVSVRRLARELHPDVSPPRGQASREAAEAHEVLLEGRDP